MGAGVDGMTRARAGVGLRGLAAKPGRRRLRKRGLVDKGGTRRSDMRYFYSGNAGFLEGLRAPCEAGFERTDDVGRRGGGDVLHLADRAGGCLLRRGGFVQAARSGTCWLT